MRSRSVRGHVRTLTIALAPLRALECAVCAASGYAVVFAAALASGARADDPAAHAAAALAALAVAALAARERFPSEAAVARALDRGLRHDGALVTAWEAEPVAAGSPVVLALVARVRAALDGPRGMRALLARTPPAALALPAAAAALLLLALERADLDRTARALELASRAAALSAGATEGRGPAELERTAAAAAEVAEAARATDEPSARLRQALTGLLGELERPPGPGPAWGELREAARDLLLDLGGSPTEAREPSPAGVAAAPGDAAGGAAGPGGAAPPGDGSSTGMEAGDSRGTMAGRGARASGAGEPAPGADAAGSGAAAEAGVLGGRWWPERYDPVVARWVESRRANRADPPAGGGTPRSAENP